MFQSLSDKYTDLGVKPANVMFTNGWPAARLLVEKLCKENIIVVPWQFLAPGMSIDLQEK